MKNKFQIIMFFSGLFLATSSHADTGSASNPTEATPTGWTAEIGLGYVRTSGNTNTTSTKGNAKAVNEIDKWRHTVTVEALKSSDDDVTTAERYFLSGKSDYKYSTYNYWFVRVSYDDDHFSGYDYRITETVGYGRRLIHEPELSLDAEIGPGARQSKTDAGENEDEFIVRLSGDLKWKISETSEFTEELSTEIGEDDTVSKSVTGLKANINKSLAMKVTYTVKNTSDVPVGVKETDTEFVVTLVYNYK
jgi:putative salt-induced outer membrane protein